MIIQLNNGILLKEFLKTSGYKEVSKNPCNLEIKEFSAYEDSNGKSIVINTGFNESLEKQGFMLGMNFYEWLVKNRRV